MTVIYEASGTVSLTLSIRERNILLASLRLSAVSLVGDEEFQNIATDAGGEPVEAEEVHKLADTLNAD